MLEHLITEGWGDAWGIYLESRASFDAARRHLRLFLMVDLGGESHRNFFRFYDPRMRRTFSEVMILEQHAQFLKGIDTILHEDQLGSIRELR